MPASKKRKTLIAVSAVVLTLALGGAAVAYFTASGSGTGTASVGTSSALTLHGSTSGSLYPGTSSTVSFTADNPSSGHQDVGTIHLASIVACDQTFSGGTCASGHEITTCESVETGASDTNTSNFWMADVVSNQDVASGNGQSLSATGTLKLNDLSTSQDSCKNANLLLNFTS
ncbi:MAG TPA: hypothetical protein VGF70_13955 [Solirubrobacteraceae bacterium]|jgi:hypothetical protein